MIRKITEKDKNIFIELMDEFYHSDGVQHTLPKHYYEKAAEEVLKDSPYMTAYLIESEGGVAGYGQLSFTYSTEAGGMVVWIEELYIRSKFRGRGLGTAFFDKIFTMYQNKATRFRLEIDPDNEGARRLYESLGFENLGYESMVIEKGC